jgi:hypothetical protein
MSSARCEDGTVPGQNGRRRRRRLLWHGLAREERVETEDEIGRIPQPVDHEITLQLLRVPALEGPLSVSDAIDALRKADALLRNVPFMTEQRIVLLRWAEAWLHLGLTRLGELAIGGPSEQGRVGMLQAIRFADLSHREVLGLIQQIEAGQVFELIGFARYYLCRSVALARGQEGVELEPRWVNAEW